MKIILSAMSFKSFAAQLLSLVTAADERRPYVEDERHEPEEHLYFETQEEVDNAYASAWVHRFHPEAFRIFPGFDDPHVDPMLRAGSGNIGRRLGGQLGKNGVPWIRKQDGVDIRGTIGYGIKKDKSSEVILPLGLTLPMEHLAFLATWSKGEMGQTAVKIDPTASRILVAMKKRTPKPPYVLEHTVYFPIQFHPEDAIYLESAVNGISRGDPLLLLVPASAEGQEYVAKTENVEIGKLLDYKTIGLTLYPERAGPVMEGSETVVNASGRTSLPGAMGHAWLQDVVMAGMGTSKSQSENYA